MRSAVLLLATAAILSATPCITTKPDCTEWITFSTGPSRSLIYRTYPLDTKNERITRAFILVHGAGRDADNYYRTALAAAFLGNALDDTIVVSPRFASAGQGNCQDKLDLNEVNWPCGGNSWRSGGIAINNDRLTSFDFADELLRKLARKDVFPNLKAIVIAGHSAGGQFVTRYEMANRVHDSLGVPVTYVVANPSSYAYPDTTRPADASKCPSYDRWPYGLENRAGYTAKTSDEQLKKQLAARPTVYLLGSLDTLPLAGFDSSCSAMAQGPSRLDRGKAWGKYVNEKYAAHHQTTVVDLCGHNARCMFTAENALPIIFPN